MEELGLRALHRRVAGPDVHRMLHVVKVLIEQPDGQAAAAGARVWWLSARLRGAGGTYLPIDQAQGLPHGKRYV